MALVQAGRQRCTWINSLSIDGEAGSVASKPGPTPSFRSISSNLQAAGMGVPKKWWTSRPAKRLLFRVFVACRQLAKHKLLQQAAYFARTCGNAESLKRERGAAI